MSRRQRRPEDVVQTVAEWRHTVASVTLVGLLTALIFAVAVLADLGAWCIS